MANPLTNEAEIYERIKRDKVIVPDFLWDAIYNFLGDYVSAIDIMTAYYIDRNEPIPIENAQQILDYTRKIIDMMNKVIYPNRILEPDGLFVKIKRESVQLPGYITDCFNHYIGNDTNIINFVVSYCLDPNGPEPVSVEYARKILGATKSMRQFLDRLREATTISKGVQ